MQTSNELTPQYERLAQAEHYLNAQKKPWDKRKDYMAGKQELPYAPDGINAEYVALQEQSIANWMSIAVEAPTQRLQVDGFRTDGTQDQDLGYWNEYWQPNKLDSRSSIVFTEMYVHGRGIMSVTASETSNTPKIRPESSRNVWLGSEPEDPFTHTWAVKIMKPRKKLPESQLWVPSSYAMATAEEQTAYVYDAQYWYEFVRRGTMGQWEYVNSGAHGLGRLPFVGFDYRVDSDGVPHSSIDSLIPQQDAMNTIRFNTLLAMQFSAYRQRVFTGYDPVVRDKNGKPLLRTNAAGELVLAEDGQPIPVLNKPGRVGVDRALVFPGKDTKVFDLPESNLDNYIKVLQEFLTDFFATGQIPPQYMLSRMANLSGDALAGAESTLQSLVKSLKRSAGEALEDVLALAHRAAGHKDEFKESEIVWADTEPRSFAQIVDAVGKLISTGMSRQDAWSMLPGATPPKVDEWISRSDAEMQAQAEAISTAGKIPF